MEAHQASPAMRDTSTSPAPTIHRRGPPPLPQPTVIAAQHEKSFSSTVFTEKDAYERIGINDALTDEEALRKAEPLLVSRAKTYERLGFEMWDEAWKVVASGRPMPAIGDAGRVEPAFAAHIAARPPAFERCLVPGCGRGHAVECLARSGRHAIGLEISSAAAKLARSHLVNTRGLTPRTRGQAEVLVGDFFTHLPSSHSLSPFEVGEPYDLIYDATFLCSLPKAKRSDWASCMSRLIKTGGELIMDVFPVADYEGGPPFAMSLELVEGLLKPLGFEMVSCEEVMGEMVARPNFRGAKEYLMRWVKGRQRGQHEEGDVVLATTTTSPAGSEEEDVEPPQEEGPESEEPMMY